jgi:ribosomal protein S18 acetylase RimI-like enzyme
MSATANDVADGAIPSDPDLLDNLAWHALNGVQADLADYASNGAAVRYRRKVSPICATDRTDVDAWNGLGELTRPGGYISLFRDEVSTPPAGWSEVFREEVSQYVATELDDPPDLDIISLGEADAEEMVALTKLTEPGPFSIKTYMTGNYFGIRREGQLLAMAGQRMRATGWGEVSAVCVHPDGLRQGLGAAMTLAAAKAITDRGDRVVLHVRDGNDPAHALYLSLGFEVRRLITVGIFRRDE